MNYIDFEFHSNNEKELHLVCCVLNNNKYWLNDGRDRDTLISALKSIIGQTLVAYYVPAEARGLLSLGINPLDYEWIDLYAEFKMLQNGWDKYEYGSYILPDGSIAKSIRPIDELSQEQNNTPVPSNLINCVFKTTGKIISSKEKDEVRSMILSKDNDLIQNNMNRIMDYCAEDVKYLSEVLSHVNTLDIPLNYIKSRGRYSAAMGIVENTGIPIDIDLLKKIEQATPTLLEEGKKEVNKHFPYFLEGYTLPPKVFKNGNVHHYKPVPPKRSDEAYQKYTDSLQLEDFPKTEGGKYKSDKDTLELYPEIPGLDALWKYNRMESGLKWFKEGNSQGFYQALGSDSRVRPMYGIYGTQTGRNAAKAKTFPFAMSNWLRAIVRPKEGYLISCDFSQQEVYVAAVLSNDDNLLDAYLSGDVYLAFGKQAGLIPENGTKSSHKFERQLCKGTVLGLQFGMGVKKLQRKLSFETGTDISLEKAQELVDAHKETYWQYWKWVYQVRKHYQKGIPIEISDGWTMFIDNPSMTSVGNMPVQGTGAAITRLASVYLVEQGIELIANLHDGLYVLSNSTDIIPKVEQAMLKATEVILGESKTGMRVDTKYISSNEYYVDEKGEEDWNKYKKLLDV